MNDYPILLDSIFPTWAIHRRFKDNDELEKWIKEKDLEIVNILQCDGYLVVIATSKDINNVERIL